MTEDEVVREVREVREAFAASHGYDIPKMVAALHDLGLASGRELVRLPPRPALAPGSDRSPRQAVAAPTPGCEEFVEAPPAARPALTSEAGGG